MSGEGKVVGITFLKVKILDIEKQIRLFVIDKDEYEYDVLIGLDTIPIFRLNLSHELKITQSISENNNTQNLQIETQNKNNMNTIEMNWNECIPIEKFEMKTSHLDKEKRKQIYEFVDKYGSIFANDQFDVGTVSGYKAHIKLIKDCYVAKKPYRCSYKDQLEIERQVSALLEHGMIEESCSPFAPLRRP
jgi:hypothetical protein